MFLHINAKVTHKPLWRHDTKNVIRALIVRTLSVCFAHMLKCLAVCLTTICERKRSCNEQAVTHQSPAPALKEGSNYIMIWKRLYGARRIRCCQLALSCSLESLMHGSDLLIASQAEDSLNVLRFEMVKKCLVIWYFAFVLDIFYLCILQNISAIKHEGEMLFIPCICWINLHICFSIFLEILHLLLYSSD